MSHDVAAIILAAGKGTRMCSPTPKVLHKVAGRSLLHHSLGAVTELNYTKKIIAVLGENMRQVEAELTSVVKDAVCVIQREQLGTGHAVKVAESALDDFEGIVFVLYADTPFITQETLLRMLHRFDVSNTLAAVVLGFRPENPGEYGRLIAGSHGDLDAIVEYKDASSDERKITLCNSGVIAVRSNLLSGFLHDLDNDNAKGEYYLTDIIEIARENGYSCAYEECAEQEVMGINSQAERAVAEAIQQKRLRQQHMENGVTLIAPETVYFAMDTQIASGVVIHPNVVFGTNVVIEAGVEIKSFSHIEGAVIGKNASVGPYARLRPGADIGEACKIGNFVEIKKSKIGKETKISHLTYIGDADIGEDVNIGAGTVTCNYDGYDKHKTTIEKGVFIGSNSSLVAPVTIGKGAMVAAGSTIIKDVKSDSVAYNKMKQKEKSGRAVEFRKEKGGK